MSVVQKVGSQTVQAYRRQRKKMPKEELAKHLGKWIAVSQDGRRILASAKTIVSLEKRLVATGTNPQDVVYEFLGREDFLLGGGELL